MIFENGKDFPRYTDEIKKLIGKTIRYLRNCDIDKSGRGYYFPKYGTIVEVKGHDIRIDETNDWVYSKDIVEYEEFVQKNKKG